MGNNGEFPICFPLGTVWGIENFEFHFPHGISHDFSPLWMGRIDYKWGIFQFAFHWGHKWGMGILKFDLAPVNSPWFSPLVMGNSQFTSHLGLKWVMGNLKFDFPQGSWGQTLYFSSIWVWSQFNQKQFSRLGIEVKKIRKSKTIFELGRDFLAQGKKFIVSYRKE